MRHETTPPTISPEIKSFCKSICGGEPIYISVIEAPEMELNNCFPNVDKLVKEGGGKRVNGWAIWQRANVFIEAEAHAVWQNDVMTLIDITPHINGEKRILFLPDSAVEYHGKLIPNRRMPLTSSPYAHEYVQLADEEETIMLENLTEDGIKLDDQNKSRLQDIEGRMRDLNVIFSSEVGRNDLCPCGSGIKFKKCCGKYNW